jgi:hypothetical protein
MDEAGAVNYAPHPGIHHFARTQITMRSGMACAMDSNITKRLEAVVARSLSYLVKIYRLLPQNRIGGPWPVQQVIGASASSAG